VKRWVSLLLLSLLAACGGGDASSDKPAITDKAEARDSKAPMPICPQVAIIRQLDTIRDYGHEPAMPEQLVAAAHMDRISGTCEYGEDGVDVRFELALTVARGPRLG